MRIGILGGSFDPVHSQHIAMAHAALNQASLDQIWFVPVFLPVHKTHKLLPYGYRRRMLEASLAAYDNFCICDVEKELLGLSYSVRTIEHLKEKHPGHDFFLIIGGDSLAQIASWKAPDRIAEMIEFLVVARPGFSTCSPIDGLKLNWIKAELSDVSSSAIRNKLRTGDFSVKGLSEEALFIILSHSLYQHLLNAHAVAINQVMQQLDMLAPDLRLHMISVARLALSYALEAEYEPQAAVLAGLSHDLFRASEAEVIMRYATKSGFELNELELNLPMLAHGAAAAGFLHTECHNVIKDVIDAVRWHTFPRSDSKPLTRILVMADLLEPNRMVPGYDTIREAALTPLERYMRVLAIKKSASSRA